MPTSGQGTLSINDLHLRFSPTKEPTLCSVSSTQDSTLRATSPKKDSTTDMSTPSHSTMSATPPLPAHAPITTIPLGFAAQLRALSDHQSRLESRITSLEHENSSLKSDLSARIADLETRNARLSSRRRETVAQFLTLQYLHQEAGNAFHLRSQDVQEEDLEGMLGVWAGSVHMVMNHHQRILGRVAKEGGLGGGGGGGQQYGMQGQGQGQFVPQAPMAMRQQMGWQYPMAYNEAGYCRAHGVAYWCRACGQ